MSIRRTAILAFLCAGCLDPYAPPASVADLNALVVDGFIDMDGSASVTLTRTVPLYENLIDAPKETGAVVKIESSGGETFLLQETDSATYTAAGLTVDKVSTYTLHIATLNGGDYRSDPVHIYTTPPIDSIYYSISPTEQLEIRVDSHISDPNSASHYQFYGIESYEYHAPVYAHYKLVNQAAVERLPEEEFFTCYRDERTPNTVASTKDLKANRLSGMIVSRIDRTSEKLSVRYSILVRQRAISEEEYLFQQSLITTTEQQGDIFAPIPGAVLGNMHSTKDPGEYVLGYFRAQDVKELRYFIDAYQNPLPEGFYQKVPSKCQSETTCYLPEAVRLGLAIATPGDCVDVSALSDGVGIVSVVTDESGIPLRYIFATAECSDCRYRGGTTTRPSFWQ